METLSLRDKQAIRLCRPVLEKLYRYNERKYIDLFFYEKIVKIHDIDLTPLVKTGILSRDKGSFIANVQVFPLSGKFICTDFNYSERRKWSDIYKTDKYGVWGILPEETPVIAKRAIVKKGDLVLDLATGSGMIAIFCAGKARKVVATDINPKAIKYARFNAILNGVEHKTEFKVGSLFNPVKRMKFDLIIWNGPTVAVPSNEKYPIYSSGGMDGADFTRKFINRALHHLKKNGRMQWYDCCAGSSGMPISMRYLIDKWGQKKIKVEYHLLTKEPVSMRRLFDLYKKWNLDRPRFRTPLAFRYVPEKEGKRWERWLLTRYTHFYYAIVEIRPHKNFSFKVIFPKKGIRRDKYLTRYYLWMSYPTLLERLRRCEKY